MDPYHSAAIQMTSAHIMANSAPRLMFLFLPFMWSPTRSLLHLLSTLMLHHAGESMGPSCVTCRDTHPWLAGCPTQCTPGSRLPLCELNSDGAGKPERSLQIQPASACDLLGRISLQRCSPKQELTVLHNLLNQHAGPLGTAERISLDGMQAPCF